MVWYYRILENAPTIKFPNGASPFWERSINSPFGKNSQDDKTKPEKDDKKIWQKDEKKKMTKN